MINDNISVMSVIGLREALADLPGDGPVLVEVHLGNGVRKLCKLEAVLIVSGSDWVSENGEDCASVVHLVANEEFDRTLSPPEICAIETTGRLSN